jgi:hypothetical protein
MNSDHKTCELRISTLLQGSAASYLAATLYQENVDSSGISYQLKNTILVLNMK